MQCIPYTHTRIHQHNATHAYAAIRFKWHVRRWPQRVRSPRYTFLLLFTCFSMCKQMFMSIADTDAYYILYAICPRSSIASHITQHGIWITRTHYRIKYSSSLQVLRIFHMCADVVVVVVYWRIGATMLMRTIHFPNVFLYECCLLIQQYNNIRPSIQRFRLRHFLSNVAFCSCVLDGHSYALQYSVRETHKNPKM